MAISRLELIRSDQPIGEILLTCFDGAQTLLVPISRVLLDEIVGRRWGRSLAPGEQDFLVDLNLPNLLPLIEGRHTQGDVIQRVNPATGRFASVITLTRDDLERGLKLPPPTSPGDTRLAYASGDMTSAVGVSLTNTSMPRNTEAPYTIAMAPTGPNPPDQTTGFSPNPVALDQPLGTVPADEIPVFAAPNVTVPQPGQAAQSTGSMTGRGSLTAGATLVATGRRFNSSSPRPGALVIDGEEYVERPKPARRKPPASVEQRPAAYRFVSQAEKIDVLPEPPQPLDREFAQDTQQELLAKSRGLLERLRRSNSARRVCDSVKRLQEALDLPFDDLRPGVLLSRLRSLEADRAAFDTEEARSELFADAFAVIDDAVQTTRDLLAAFPTVRQIEGERLALDLDRQPDAVLLIEQRTDEIRVAAEQSGAATESAVKALAQNDAAIASAADPLLRTRLIADKLLVVGNFARAAASRAWTELNEVGAASWEALKRELPIGVGIAARVGPLMALTVAIAGPIGGLASATPALKPLAGVFKKMVGDSLKDASTKRENKVQKLDLRQNQILNMT